MALIDSPNYWDAIQIVGRLQNQVWDEILAVECPTLDDTKDVIPQEIVRRVFDSSASKLLTRVEYQIMESYRNR